ncbi:MAG: serine/threonine-protein kinase [Polyangiales bacterium]
MTDLIDDPLLGQLIDGKYRLVSRIGAGGMGKVYRAEQVALGRSVAVKVLDASPGHRDADPAVERRFFLEASLSAKLAHPNVITVHDYGRVESEDGARFYLVMELLEGETLHRRLQRGPTPVPAADAVAIAIEIARGLRAAHKAGLVHRDLKPANVMLVPSDEGGSAVKILDFGLVKQLEGELREDITQEGTFLGSPRYMAPEQVSAGPVDHRCDLYALGVILYQCLTGLTPFDGKTAMDVLVKHINAPVPWMQERAPGVDVSPALEAIVRRLLEKNPAARFPDAESVVNALRDVAATFRGDVTVASRSQSGAMKDPALQQLAIPMPTAATTIVATEPSGTIAGTSVSSAQTRPKKSSTVLVAAVGGLTVVAAVALVAMNSARNGRDNAGSSSAASRPPSTTTAQQPTTNGAAPAQRGVLRIESTPSGAAVRENSLVLGTTPLEVAIDPSGSPRRFEVVQQGFAPYSFEQRPIAERVTVVAALSAESATQTATNAATTAPVRRTQHSANNVRRTNATTTVTTRTSTNAGGDEIRLQR